VPLPIDTILLKHYWSCWYIAMIKLMTMMMQWWHQGALTICRRHLRFSKRAEGHTISQSHIRKRILRTAFKMNPGFSVKYEFNLCLCCCSANKRKYGSDTKKRMCVDFTDSSYKTRLHFSNTEVAAWCKFITWCVFLHILYILYSIDIFNVYVYCLTVYILFLL